MSITTFNSALDFLPDTPVKAARAAKTSKHSLWWSFTQAADAERAFNRAVAAGMPAEEAAQYVYDTYYK